MPILPLSKTSDDRTDFGLPRARLVNMFVEAVREGPQPDGRFQRYGLSPFASTGTAPASGIYYASDAFNLIFAPAGNTLYGVTLGGAVSNLGSMPAQTRTRSASSRTQRAFIGSDGGLYVYGGSPAALTKVSTMSDGATAVPSLGDLAYLSGRFIYSVTGSNQLYFSAIGDATVIDPSLTDLADSTPGAIVAMETLGDELAIFKTDAVEWWQVTSDPNNPYQRAQGRNYERGCVSRGSVTLQDNSLWWVGDDYVVYRTGSAPQRVSTHGVEQQLRDYGSDSGFRTSAFSPDFVGHSMVAITTAAFGDRTNSQTFAYDISTGQWYDWPSGSDSGAFLAPQGVLISGVNYVASAVDGTIYTMTPTALSDGGAAISRVISAFMPQPSGTTRCDNVSLLCRTGLAGAGVSPNAQMRYSDDNGQTWSAWLTGSLGTTGQSPLRITWRRLGRIKAPGRAFEFLCADPAPFVVEGATINEFRP